VQFRRGFLLIEHGEASLAVTKRRPLALLGTQIPRQPPHSIWAVLGGSLLEVNRAERNGVW
jgi:hypothetical protein